MPTIYFYRMEYSPGHIDELVTYLVANTDELRHFQGSSIEAITGLMAWGDFRSSVEAFRILCDVLIAVRTALGEHVLALDDEVQP